MMYAIIVLENLRFCPSTRKREDSFFKNLHSGERFWKDTFAVTEFTEYIRVTVGQTGKFKLNRIRVDRALVVSYRNIMLIQRFWRENNFFVFLLFVSLSLSLELPHTTTTKVTPVSKYPMKIKVYKVVPKQISDFTQI